MTGSVELRQVAVAAQAAGGAQPLPLAERLDRERGQPVEIEAVGPALGEVGLDPPRELVRAVGREARDHQRPRHQPLRVGRRPRTAERQRIQVEPLTHTRPSPASAPAGRRRLAASVS